MLSIQQMSYAHPNKDVLFSLINFNIGPHQKLGLIGNNGAGKSTLLRIMAGLLPVTAGTVHASEQPYYLPQIYGQFNHLTIAEALRIDKKLQALEAILAGEVSEENMNVLGDDWTIAERVHEALTAWGLGHVELTQSLQTLSGGQKTKLFLAGIAIHDPGIILLDEPSNHLDASAREQLYEWLRKSNSTIVVVSHDRALLNLLDTMFELSNQGITQYGGNYDFYTEQKRIEGEALAAELKSKEKALRKAKEVERDSIERQQKLDARGKKKQEKAGLPTISMNTLRNNAERSTAKLKSVHSEKTGNMSRELNELRKEMPDKDRMKIGFDPSQLHKGKVLFTAKDINIHYNGVSLWRQPVSFSFTSGERIGLSGPNGSGKTSLLKLIMGQLEPTTGTVYRAMERTMYIDQDYSLISDALTVYEQAAQFNHAGLQEHEIKIRLNRFLFSQEFWNKSCSSLSGGEKMRLMLCCLTIGGQSPDLIILDEPTNNLDIRNIEMLTAAINEYEGSLLVVSHDQYFLQEINIGRTVQL